MSNILFLLFFRFWFRSFLKINRFYFKVVIIYCSEFFRWVQLFFVLTLLCFCRVKFIFLSSYIDSNYFSLSKIVWRLKQHLGCCSIWSSGIGPELRWRTLLWHFSMLLTVDSIVAEPKEKRKRTPKLCWWRTEPVKALQRYLIF